MSYEDWRAAINPKVHGSWNLHKLLPDGMDFFVFASSITGIIGQPTQINYAAGNTYQDALARYRLSIGEKAVSLDLGILLTGGLLAQNEGLSKRLIAEKVYTPLTEQDILGVFHYFCNPHLDLRDLPSQVICGIIPPGSHDASTNGSYVGFAHPFWSHTQVKLRKSSTIESNSVSTNSPLSLALTGSRAEISEKVATALADQFSLLAMRPREKINLEDPLHTAGVDSLSAVYLRNWVMKQFQVDMAVFDILGDRSITDLGGMVAREWIDKQNK